VLWVGVHCAAKVAAGREIARGERVVGGASSQATRVHEEVFYDLEVDTTSTESLECAASSLGTCPEGVPPRVPPNAGVRRIRCGHEPLSQAMARMSLGGMIWYTVP
jgi:hypothetical protein